MIDLDKDYNNFRYKWLVVIRKIKIINDIKQPKIKFNDQIEIKEFI